MYNQPVSLLNRLSTGKGKVCSHLSGIICAQQANLRSASRLSLQYSSHSQHCWRQAQYVDGTHLRFALTLNDMKTAGAAKIQVFNAPPGGGMSSGVTFTVFGHAIYAPTIKK
jgi:hypothetical protein